MRKNYLTNLECSSSLYRIAFGTQAPIFIVQPTLVDLPHNCFRCHVYDTTSIHQTILEPKSVQFKRESQG